MAWPLGHILVAADPSAKSLTFVGLVEKPKSSSLKIQPNSSQDILANLQGQKGEGAKDDLSLAMMGGC